MNGHDDEAWLDTLRQRPLPSGPSDEAFSERVLERLPPRERPVRRALLLGVTWMVALAALFLPSAGGAGGLATSDADSLLVPSTLGAALLWYVVERRR